LIEVQKMIDETSTKEGQNDRDVVMAEIKQNLKALLSIHGAALERMKRETTND
jgi:hypothetical protein